MTLSTLLITFTIVAAILTALMVFILKIHKKVYITYIQNFLGVWYIFSGWVKAVDPLGTSYKLEQYFTEFETTFEPTWLGFISPLFPFLSSIAIYVSVFVILLEILLGVALIIGWRPKFTGRLFFLLLVFFTVLTGFTYLTGYVGNGVNFFEFSKWGEFSENNMKVKDCGCFGDFIKLKPKVSFFKDVFLLIPAFIVLFGGKSWHQLFSKGIRSSILAVTALGLLIYCMSNFAWDIPSKDFRPFKIGADIKAERNAQLNAMGSVKILAWKLKNRSSGKVVELSNDVYMKEFKSYPKEEWEIIDQVKSKPSIEANKISEMEFSSFDGYDVTEEILDAEGPSFLIVAHKLYAKPYQETMTVLDSLFVTDTLQRADDGVEMFVKRFDRTVEKQVEMTKYKWDEGYIEDWKTVIKPIADKAKEKGAKMYVVSGGATEEMAESLKNTTGIDATYLNADDILLKTIVRSNPGIVLWENGKILNKWHKSKFPGIDNCGL